MTTEGQQQETTAKKRFALETLLSEERSVYLLINTAFENVVLPSDFLKSATPVVLQLGLNLSIPIRDLEITSEGWSATLSFSRRLFKVWIPWGAVCEIVNEDKTRGARFPESYPTGIAKQISEHRDKQVEKRKTLPPGWRVVEGEKKE
jgi:hypothetical protein